VKNPTDSEDPYLGRTLAVHVTPPHNSENIRLHLSGLEEVPSDNTKLLVDIFATSPTEDAAIVDFRNPDGVGSSPDDPMAFITNVYPDSIIADIPRRAGYQYTIKARQDCKVAIFII
jgi:hypothetical protein